MTNNPGDEGAPVRTMRHEIWRRYGEGESVEAIARALEIPPKVIEHVLSIPGDET